MITERRNRSARRHLAEQVLHRAGFLPSSERLILEQVYGAGVTPAHIAAVTGHSPSVVQRRVRSLVRRLTHPDVVFVLNNHSDWAPEVRDVGMAMWVRGQTMRQTAFQLEMSLHAVRQHVEHIRGLIEQGRRRARLW